NADNGRIDVVEPIDVALAAVDRERAGSESDHPDLQRRNARMQRLQRPPDPGRRRVVRGRPMRELGQKILRSMEDRSVNQRPMSAGRVAAEFLYTQHAIEVPLRKQRRIIELMDTPCRRTQREKQRQAGKRDEHEKILANLE